MNKDKRLELFLQFESLKSVYVKDREFHKDIIMERNSRKKYIHVDRGTGSHEIFAMLDKIESETESDTENLLEDSDTEYIAEEPIPDNKEESYQLLTPEATVHVEGEFLDIDETSAKKHKKKVAELKWKRTSKFGKAIKYILKANVLLDTPENANPLLIFERNSNLNEIVKHVYDQTNLYATQNGREFATNPGEIHAFLGISYIMSISKLPNVKCYGSVDSYLSNDDVRNAMARNSFMNILQNLHFTDNQIADKSDKAYKMRIVINHLNKAFQDAMSDAERQSIDKHMTKFKGRMSCKQYMKNKPIKWDFNGWC